VPSSDFFCVGGKIRLILLQASLSCQLVGLGNFEVFNVSADGVAWRGGRPPRHLAFHLCWHILRRTRKMPLFSQSVPSNCEPSVIYIGDRRDDSVALRMRVDRQWNRWGSPGAGRRRTATKQSGHHARRPSLDGSRPPAASCRAARIVQHPGGRLPPSRPVSIAGISIASGSTRL